jgi:hypothetical protein
VGGVSNGSVWASGFDPDGRHDDLPLVLCQANQIPNTAIEIVKMPKTICMMVSSSMVCMCVEAVGRSAAVEQNAHLDSELARNLHIRLSSLRRPVLKEAGMRLAQVVSRDGGCTMM